MAFPSIRSQATDNSTSAETTHTVNLPATIAAGDTILVIIRVAVAGAIGWPDANWHELLDASPDGSDDQIGIAWKKADGSEGGTTISVTSGNGKYVSVAAAFRDAFDPSITPPVLGTVGIGTTPDEPNAGDCAPGVGAKDFYWWTHYSMSGEQSGITAYPGSYTLDQSGIVTSGTGGLPATNCTMATAGRQLNAASENTGVWDVTGTLIDWAAYTIAFSPAEPITLPLPNGGSSQPVFIARTPALIGAGLTIAVNLLQTTLAPTVVNYSEQEVLISNKPSIKLNELTIVNNLLQSTLKPVEVAPFVPVDWSNPLVKKSNLVGFVFTQKLEEVDLPIGKINYPVSLIRKSNPVGFLISRKPDEPTDFPFIPVKFENPLIKKRNRVGFEFRYRDLNSLVPIKNNWPNPDLRKKPANTWTNNLLESTLAPAVASIPNRNYNYPNPGIRKGLIIDISTFINSEPVVAIQNRNHNWPNPEVKKRIIVDVNTVINSDPPVKPVGGAFLPSDIKIIKGRSLGHIDFYTFGDDNFPFVQSSWVNPVLRKRQPITFVHSRKIDEPAVIPPFKPIDYKNSLIKIKSALNWTYLGQFQQIFTSPVGSRIYDVPVRKFKSSALTWINPGYTTSAITIVTPFNQTNWTNPLGRRSYQIVGNKHFLDVVPGIQPFNQKDWPLALKKKLPIKWEDKLTIDQNLPDSFKLITLPPARKLIPAISWIQSPLVASGLSSLPIGKSAFEVPLIKRKIALTWIEESISISAEFFNNIIWPLPDARKVGTGWVNSIILPVQDLPFNQLNWLNPLIKNRNQVGFIDFPQGTDEKILNVYDLAIPVRLRKSADTWLVNLLQSTLEPAVGEVPVGTSEWPNPFVIKRINKDWIYNNTAIPIREEPLNNEIFVNPSIKKVSLVGWISTLRIEDSRIISGEIFEVPGRKIVIPVFNYNNTIGIVSPFPLIRNNDYPNPGIKRRNQVGFEFGNARLITGNLPFNFTEWPIGVKRKIALTWIDNTIQLETAIVGAKPFNQSAWPNPLRGKWYDIYTINGVNFIVLPNIKGRKICLIAGLTEFELEAMIEEFELNAMQTDYNLDAGGDECE